MHQKCESFLESGRAWKVLEKNLRSLMFKLQKELDYNIVAKLSVQKRFVNEIAEFPNIQFYQQSLITDVDESQRYWICYRDKKIHSAFLNIATEDNPCVYVNEKEAICVKHIVENISKIVTGPQCAVVKNDVVVLSFFKDQVSKIKSKLNDDSIEVKTVDSYQGKQKKIVILSCGKNSRNLGFLDRDMRINVALTRAQDVLLIIGSHSYFKKQNNHNEFAIQALARFYENTSRVYECTEFTNYFIK